MEEELEAVTNWLWFLDELKPDDLVYVNFNEYPICDWLPMVTTLLEVFGKTPRIKFWKAKKVPP